MIIAPIGTSWSRFFPPRMPDTPSLFHIRSMCRDNDFNVSINHDQAEARFMTAPRSYSVWKVSDLIRKDEEYPAEPVSPGEIIFRGWL